MVLVTHEQRAALVQMQQAFDNARDANDQSVRGYRTVLIIAILLLLASAAILPFVIPRLAPDLTILRTDANGAPTKSSNIALDILQLEVWGAVGGLMGLIVSLRRLTSRHPARLHLWQLLLKIPAGAMTAVFGIVFIQAAIVPSTKAVSVGQLAAYAVLFGFAQEAATSLVDRQAGRLLEQAKTIDDTAPA
jgi:hypothetical protein